MFKMSKSIRKYIRREKAKIRREILGFKKQGEKINELRQRFLKKTKEVKEPKPDKK